MSYNMYLEDYNSSTIVGVRFRRHLYFIILLSGGLHIVCVAGLNAKYSEVHVVREANISPVSPPMYARYIIVVPPMMDGRYQSGRFLELLNYALNPANEFVMEELFNAGFESGELAFSRALQGTD